MRALLRFLRRLLGLGRTRRFQHVVFVGELPDVPAAMAADTIYVAGPASAPKWAALTCPCDVGHRVTLPLRGLPSWRVQRGRRGPTVHPSIDVRGDLSGGTRCHYWVREGRVEWVPISWTSDPSSAGR